MTTARETAWSDETPGRVVDLAVTKDWRPVTAHDRGRAVVIRSEGWACGRTGRVVGPAGPPGWFTVRLDDGTKFLSRPGEAVAPEREADDRTQGGTP